MDKNIVIHEAKNMFAEIPGVISIYLYGSFLREDFHSKSDIDLLIVVKDEAVLTLAKVFKNVLKTSSLPFEATVVTESEVKEKLHASWSKFLYYNVKHSGILIHGRNILEELGDYEISFNEIFKKIIWLCQRVRSVCINGTKEQEIKFWERKMRKWMKIVCAELLYLHGIYESIPSNAYNRFFSMYSNLHKCDIESGDLIKMLETLEQLRLFCSELKYNMQVRQGVACIVFRRKKDSIEFLLLERSDQSKGWEIVKGGIEKSETLEDAARREVLEEAGLADIKFVGPVPHLFEFNLIRNGILEKRVYQTVAIEHVSGQIKVEEPMFREGAYFSPEDTRSKIMWPKYREAVFHTLNHVKANSLD